MVVFLAVILGIATLLTRQGVATLHGRVIDAQTRSPVAQVTVLVDGVTAGSTDAGGEFTLAVPPRPQVELMLTAVGYGFVKRILAAGDGLTELGTIALNRESAALSEHVTVTAASIADADRAPRMLTRSDLEALSMVIIDDPLRSVHALPGVAANNDLRAEFSLRGAGFDQIGVYVDGVRTGGFVHTLSDSGTTDRLSLSIVNQDTIGSAALTPGVAAVASGGATAGALELETREGNRERLTAHASTGFLASSGVLEGPLVHGKGSWLVAGRTTRADYVQRIVEKATRGGDKGGGQDLQFWDVHAKMVVDLSARHQLGVSLLGGVFTNDQGHTSRIERAGDPNAVDRARSGNWLRSVNWRFTPGSRVFTQVRVFSAGSSYRERNENGVALTDSRHTSTGFRADLTFQASAHHLFQAGLYAQQARERSRTTFDVGALEPRQLGAVAAHRVEPSWYVQDRWTIGDRVTMTPGVRVDRAGDETLVSPRIGATMTVGKSWTIRGAAGVQTQAPPLAALHGLLGNPALRASRSVEVDAAVERRVSDRVTFTVDLYRRRDRDQLFALAEPRLEHGRVTAALHPFQNALDGRARGVEAAIRRGSANRLSGWIGYAFGVARVTDAADGLAFPSDFEQRHTVNAAGSYRLSGTLAFTVQWRYGSGMPRPGFLQETGGGIEIGPERNLLRLKPYQRLDLKVRKVYVWGRRTFTISGEVLNVLNNKNEYNVQSTVLSLAETGRFISGQRPSFPVLPAVGLSIRF